jgi:hypothetical protein
MTYRNDLEALAARHDALATEVATKTKELDAARQLLDDAKQRAKLPVLPNIRVASPCPADWNQMTGDDRVRACAQCNKSVYNLSNMTRDEAEALIVAKEGKLCVRYFQRKDGTILMKDCVVGVAQKRKRRVIAAGAAALLAGGGVLAYLRSRPVEQTRSHELLGEVAVDMPPDRAVAPESLPPLNAAPDEWREVKGDIAAPIEEGAMVQQGQVMLVAPK